MTDLTIGVTLKADGSGFVGTVKVGTDELRKLGATGKQAGEQASKGVDGLSSSLGKMKGFVLSAIGAYAGFSTVQRLLGAVTREIMAAEKASANLNAVLRATGGSVGFTADELSDLADQLERSTLFDDAEIKQAEAVLLTFRRVQGDTFREAIGLATDLAALMGGDLQGAVLQLGKALEDPITGLTALRRSGISFTEQQQKLIKSLVETGDQAKAMRIILDTVAGQIGGVASEQVIGLTGALNQLDDAWGDLLKSFANTGAFDVAIQLLDRMASVLDRLNVGKTSLSSLSDIQKEIAVLEAQRDEIMEAWQGFDASRTAMVADVIQDALGGTGVREKWAQQLMEIDAKILQLQEAAQFVRAGNQLTPDNSPIPQRPSDGGSGEESDAAKKIRETIEALQFEEAQLGRTTEQQELYNALHQAGVDINSQSGQTIEALVLSIQRKTDAQILTEAAQDAANATMEEGRELTEAMRTPTEVYADTVAHLSDLLAQGSINQETFKRAVDLADKTLEKATEATDTWKESWKNVGAVSTEALADILLHAESATDVLDGLAQQLLQIASQKLFAGPLDKLFDGIFDSLFPTASRKGNIFVDGNIVPFRKGGVNTTPAIFPMASGGLGSISEEGQAEGIFPLKRMGNGDLGVRGSIGGGGGVEVNVYAPPGSKVQQQQRKGNDGRTIVDVVIGMLNDDVRSGRSFSRTMEQTYGLSRRTR